MRARADVGSGAPGADGILVVVGDLVEDIVVRLAGPLHQATDNAATIIRRRGGSAANAAAAAAPLVPTRFVGCVGPDAAGDALVAGLAAAGVETRVARRGTTGAVVCLVDAAGERTMFPDRGASALIGPAEPAWLDGAAWLHVPAYGLGSGPAREAVLGLAALARGRGVRASLDASSTGLIKELGHASFLGLVRQLAPAVVLANADEAALLPPDVAPVLVVKHGPDPAEVLHDGARVAWVAAMSVGEVADTTGAGDAFAAGFLASLLRCPTTDVADLVRACEAGHRAAAELLRTR